MFPFGKLRKQTTAKQWQPLHVNGCVKIVQILNNTSLRTTCWAVEYICSETVAFAVFCSIHQKAISEIRDLGWKGFDVMRAKFTPQFFNLTTYL